MAIDDALAGLAERLQARCLAAGLTVATAESCTGGLVAHAITSIAGSSGYFRGGLVTYDDAVKRNLLGVPAAVLEAHGAVSAQTARAMATGARERVGATLAVSVTGIAGPSGATDEKPVGLTYVATANATGVDVRRHHWSGDRAANVRSSAIVALEMLLSAADGAAGSAPEEAPRAAAGSASRSS
ncbi:MAG TPA: CinA family protein [Candidatus Limnocylindrales bacterium]|nr:CinA family protein [Candidatus Limnocylindrales bacterium]